MDSPSPIALHPALLTPGTVLGNWRVEALAGGGAHGAVYRAVPCHDEHACPVALKLALLPGDPRFTRERELLSRCFHPSIPRLVDHGAWQSPSGTAHPFLVMEWVNGGPLYEQARLHPPAPARVRLWLAQLAQALAVLHAQGAVHRDFKGDNVLVRRLDDRAMLMDFGTGLYPGTASLTPAMGFPGTPLYRSPESWLFEIQFHGSTTALYRPSSADDLYALGVTACRLLTGEYPELSEPFRDEHGTWHLKGVRLPRSLRNSLVVDPSLRPLILRLLSVQPEQRGTAAQLAQELEPVSPVRSSPPSVKTRAPWRHAWLLLPATAAGLALALWRGQTASHDSPEQPSVARAEPMRHDSPDAGTAGLGDAATVAALEPPPSGSMNEAMIEDTLPEPQPGQMRPDEKGRCPRKGAVALNGGCWEETAWEPEKCQELGGQMFKGTCYVPFIPPGRKHPPTSGPPKTP
ncbi:MAG: serine/threonine-protein kinase [Hyalangium sp.]|uniref:serine/threonine-protein kinase n=1 Tax=Hyalangium sp. TaxID=2028555 RepID=UPI00389A60BF